jgi:hypothetical protein
METPLTGFRAQFRQRMLDLLWRQWTALGVSGQLSPWKATPLDPEALLLVTCTVARQDARLFDAVLDWLGVNGRYVNVGRLRRMLKDYPFAGAEVYSAVAEKTSTPQHAVKWARSLLSTKVAEAGAGEQTWLFLQRPDLAELSPLAQSSELRRVLKSGIAEDLARSGLPMAFGGEESQAGEALMPFFVERMGGAIEAVERLGR